MVDVQSEMRKPRSTALKSCPCLCAYRCQLLRTNPNLLLNIGEADLEADPLYGELTCAG